MAKEDEKNVAAAICKMSQDYDYHNIQDVKDILSKIGNNKLFQQTMFGMRYINRLATMIAGSASSSCILCGKHADNQVMCSTCMNTISPYVEKMQQQNRMPQINIKQTDTYTDNQTTSIEDLFKDMDDSLMQLASQSTVGTIKKLSWINITLSIINSIVIFFLALFLWKFIMAQ